MDRADDSTELADVAAKPSTAYRSSEGSFSRVDESVSGLASSCTTNSSNTAIGLRARLWRVDHRMWRKFTGQARDDEENELNLLRNVSSAYNSSVHVPQKSRRDSSICGLPVIDPYSWLVSIWTRFIILFDMSYTAFLVPISVGFQTNEVHKWNGIIDIIAGIIFVMALFMGFHIGFIAQYNLRRIVVKDGRHVASYYMQRGTFAIDLVSVAVYMIQIVTFAVTQTVGIDQSNIVIFWVMHAIQVLRMVRLYSVFGVVKYLLISASTGGSRMVRNWLKPAFLYTAVIAYMLAFVVNATASLWFYVGSSYSWYNDDNWIAKFLGLEYPCLNVHFAWQFPSPAISECPDTPVVIFYEAFFMSIYWSVTTLTTVGYGDVTPSNIGEVIVAIIVMLIGIMSFAVLIGSMQEVFKNASDTARNVSVLREKLEAVDTWLKKRRIPKSIQSQVRRFYHEAWLQREQDYMESEIFEELPHQLRAVVAQHQTSEMLSKIRVFQSLSPEERKIVASKLVPVTLGVGQDICSQGDFADRMWIMQEGTMVAMYGDKMAEVEKAPNLICETAILADVDPQFEIRPCGYRSATTCVLWEFKMRDLRALVSQFPYLKRSLDREVSQHVLERAGLFPDGVGAYNMEIVRNTAKNLQMHASTRGAAAVSADAAASDSDDPAASDRQDSISLSGVGEVHAQCLENLASQMNNAVHGSSSGSPAKRDDPIAEVQVDAKMMDGEESKQSLPPLLINSSPHKGTHSPSSPSSSALGRDVSDVSAALREILRHVKGMDARLSEMEAATPASVSGAGRPRFGSPLGHFGPRSSSARHPL